MTDFEAIKQLKMQRTFTYGSDAKVLNMAVKALENQERIKEVFTHYGFYENMINDCISALSEIKAILKE